MILEDLESFFKLNIQVYESSHNLFTMMTFQENAEGRALLKSLRLKVGVKCLEWSKSQNNVILVLSREGKLSVGSFTSELKPVANEVEAGRILL